MVILLMKEIQTTISELFIELLCTKRFTNLLSSGAVKHPQHLLKVQCNLDSPSSFRGYVNFIWVSFLQFNSTSKKQWRKSGRYLSGATPEENRKEPTVWGAVELKIAPKIPQSKRGRFTHRDWLQPLKWRRIPLEDACWESDNHL